MSVSDSKRAVTDLLAQPDVVERRRDVRRTLRRARRVLSAQLSKREVDPDVLAAAELLAEAGGRRD